MTLKRVSMPNLKEHSVSFASPVTGIMIHSDGAKEQMKLDKKTGLTPLTAFLENCTSARLFLVGKLTDTNRAYYELDTWIADGIYSERSYTLKKGKQRIDVRATCKSFFPSCTDVQVAYDSYKALSNMYKQYAKMPLLSSPSSTGLTLLQTTLPHKVLLTPLDEKYETLIREYTTQPRQEVLTLPDVDIIDDFYYGDGIWMYAACLDYEMPIGQPIHDAIPVYEPFVPGWYRVTAIVPNDWQHVGLVPQPIMQGKEKIWNWSSAPSEIITTWIAEPELRVAMENGWSIKILERLLFPKDRPFRNWRKLLVTMREQAGTIEDEQIRKQVKDAFRQIMLTAIGRLYSKSWKREKRLTIDEYVEQLAELPVSSRLNAIRSGNSMIIPVTDTLNEKDKRYYHPELASYIWSYCRRLVTQQMLALPRESLLGCRLDAIYTCTKPAYSENPKIGQFRLKGELHQQMKAPKTLDDLHTLSELSENPKAV